MTSAPIRSLLRGDAGAIAPLAALTLAVVIGLAGLVIDVGVWYVQRSNLQSATDAAALGAANEPGNATQLAGTLLSKNGFGPSNLVSAQAGYYCPSATLAPAARFSVNPCATGDETPTAPNAVKLVAQTTGPALLTRVLGGTGRAIQTSAIAARIDEAGLTVASGLASVDLNIANGVLGSLVGGSGLSLSLLQYNGLLNTNVDAKLFFNALAANLHVTAGTYDQLLSSQAKVGDVLQASIDALNQQNNIADVSAAIGGLQAIKSKLTGNPSITLGSLFDLGVWRDQPVGSSSAPAALEAGLNAYQIATFALQLGNGSHAATIPSSGLNIPGLLGVNLQATAIEPPQSAYFAFGPAGISVHTAQVRLLLSLQVIPPLIQLPLYVEVAQGDATLSSIGCGTDPATDGWVKVQAKTGVASVYIGAPVTSTMTNFSSPVTVNPTPIVSVPLPLLPAITVSGRAVATASSTTPTTLTFTQPPITGIPASTVLSTAGYLARLASGDGGPAASPGWPAQAVSTDILGGLTSQLASSLTLYVCVSTCVAPLPAVQALALGLISGVLTPLLQGLDPLVDKVLEALGVKIGTMEVMVTGLRCGVPVLVG